jgi:hypothetical protein
VAYSTLSSMGFAFVPQKLKFLILHTPLEFEDVEEEEEAEEQASEEEAEEEEEDEEEDREEEGNRAKRRKA